VLFGDEFESRLAKIKNGDKSVRDELIDEAKPFIAGVVGRLCGRSLNWDRDDELSIGLIAFNEAIDRFKVDHRVPFTAFARLVIRSRVTDFLRKEMKWNQVDLSFSDVPEVGENRAEFNVSWEQFITEIADRERREEIQEFTCKINELGISFQDLVQSSPKHSDTRENLVKAAQFLASNSDLYCDFESKKRLPINEISQVTGISRKVLERGRKYIIAVATLLFYREDFLYLRSYIKLPKGG